MLTAGSSWYWLNESLPRIIPETDMTDTRQNQRRMKQPMTHVKPCVKRAELTAHAWCATIAISRGETNSTAYQ